MVDTSKMVFGDQFQIRLDPSKLEAKSRKQWGELYIDKQIEKSRMFLSSASLALASALSFIAGIQFNSLFIFVAFFLGFLSLKAFYDFGYEKGILDDWETKIMIRVDK